MTETKKKISKKFTAEIIKDKIVNEIVSLNHGRAGDALLRPNMAIVMVGEDAKSKKSIEKLEKEGVVVGIDTHSYICPGDSDQEEIKAMIECLNEDELIDGIYVQLPLPDNFDKDEVLGLVKSDKDLNIILEDSKNTVAMQQAKLFRAVLDNFMDKDEEEL